MVRVGVLGSGGRMGAEVCRAVEAAADLELVAAMDPACAGASLEAVTGLRGHPLTIGAGLEQALAAGAEVVVDFTTAASAAANLERCAAEGLHVVCGTTGIDAATLDRLGERLADPGAPNAVVAPNFAISAVLLLRLAELAAPFFEGIEVVELHHEHKRDAPSGTALETARRIAEARRARHSEPLVADPTTEEVLAGARGGEGAGGVRVHSVRLPGLVAHEEVLFGALGQSLTIRQDSYDRRSFMPGVLLAVRKVAATPGLTLGLEPLLEL